MFLISRYIIKTHIAPFLFGTLTVLFLFLFQFILKYIDQLVGKGIDNWVIFQLIVLNIPWMLVLAVPMGILFAVLMSFGAMASYYEITIIKTSGGSLIKMMIPILIFATFLTGFLFWFNDDVLPDANHKAKGLYADITKTKPTFSLEAGQFTSQIEGYTIIARQLDSARTTMKGVTIYDNSRSDQYNIASSDSGQIFFSPDNSKMIIKLFNGEIHQFLVKNLNNYKKIDYSEYQIQIATSGFAFERTSDVMVARGDREMKISDMQAIVYESRAKAKDAKTRISNRLNEHLLFLTDGIIDSNTPQSKQISIAIEDSQQKIPDNPIDSGKIAVLKAMERRITFLKSSISSDIFQVQDFDLRAKQYKVEIHKKYAIPFACLLFVLVGCPLGIITKQGNFGISAAISLGFYIFYWACLIGGEKLADRGIMEPFISMWLGNLIILGVGIYLTVKVNNESL